MQKLFKKWIDFSNTHQVILAISFLNNNYHSGKVYVFQDGHKKLQNLHRRFDVYLGRVKSTEKILTFFVAF